MEYDLTKKATKKMVNKIKEFFLNLIWFEPLGMILFLGITFSFWIALANQNTTLFIVGLILLGILVGREEMIYMELKRLGGQNTT